ncbi:MAG: TOPRIM nucleotidyl transferase/hydrolase domain-containing protein, partial [Actinomycetota bacterium]
MDGEQRASLARRALAGYAHGPGAPQQATAVALEKARRAEALILVEGICDQIAIETLAGRYQRNLEAEGITVLPVGGAQAVTPHLREFGPQGEHLELAGLCDADAAETFRRALITAGVGRPATEDDMAELGFHVCQRDLEEELIRAVGPDAVEAVIESQGDLGSFRTFQKQPDWR